jgi:hypothetical protein
MNDLDIAKSHLSQKELTLTIVKEGSVLFESGSHRISGFLGAIEQFGVELEGASVADHVVGKAIAFLCVYAGIREVYAEVLSRKAHAVLEEKGILCQWKEMVDNILSLNSSCVCPFEKAASGISDPEDAYTAFKALQDSFKVCR